MRTLQNQTPSLPGTDDRKYTRTFRILKCSPPLELSGRYPCTIRSSTMKILIVDDERDVEPLFRLRFRREIARGEMELLFAFSGEEALEQLGSHGKADVILVLSDINMPGMTGLELLEQIKHDPPPVPVCMMTAYDNADFRQRAEALQCDGYVAKPIDFKALKETIMEFAA